MMDAIDKKILSLLCDNARLPLKQIAEKVFLSSPAVSARIERLEASGIITGYHAAIKLQKVGYNIQAFVNVVLASERQEEFYEFINNTSGAVECYHVAGAYSMLLKVCFQDTAKLDSFVAGVQKFGNTQTQIVFSQVLERRDITL